MILTTQTVREITFNDYEKAYSLVSRDQLPIYSGMVPLKLFSLILLHSVNKKLVYFLVGQGKFLKKKKIYSQSKSCNQEVTVHLGAKYKNIFRTFKPNASPEEIQIYSHPSIKERFPLKGEKCFFAVSVATTYNFSRFTSLARELGRLPVN